jgi:hypothetical protein
MAGGNAVGGAIIEGAGTGAAFGTAGLLSLAGAAIGVLWRSRLRGAPVSNRPE